MIVINSNFTGYQINRRPTKKPSVYPMEIVEIECPADQEAIAVYA